jgi:predicted  nucleic acid-binding Zn-ribbon protein
MNPDLAGLVQLHQLEVELARLEHDLAEVPRQRKALDERLARDRSRLEAAKAAAEASAKARRQHESAVQDLEVKRSRYKGQLMDVKTNKEYTAMLHEIENVEREIRSREDLVLEEMEKAEELKLTVRNEEADFRVVEQAGRTERAALEAREAALAAEASRLRAERDRVRGALPEEPRELYQRVAKLRGTAVAEAKDGVCQTCHVKMRLQVWVELRSEAGALRQCESCSRILYYEPPPPTVAVEP